MTFAMRRQLFAAALCALSSFAHAAVVDYADIDDLTTFQDTLTGRVWLDVDNFFDAASNHGTRGPDMLSVAQQAGFTFATRADVLQLMRNRPRSDDEWIHYAAVMGSGIPRSLIWGMYDDGNGNPFGWVWFPYGHGNWIIEVDRTDVNTIQNEGHDGALDMGLWAYISPVPLPSGFGLFSACLLAIDGGAWRRQARREH